MGIAVSEELFAPVSPGIELCYQTFGNPDDEPLLLVMGLGGPMVWWDPDFCSRLAERGFFVVRYDNRDTGRSTKVPGRVRRSDLVRAFAGRSAKAPYGMADLAADAVGLMDHLGWDSAHLMGMSMGGMIVQTVALQAPRRVRSLTSIMSTTGRRTVGWQHPSLLPTLVANRGATREEYIAATTRIWQRIESPGFDTPVERTRKRAADTFDRGVSRSGVLRQMMAVLTQPDRTRALGALSVPAAVVHGTADKMVHLSGGRATARAIPGAELLVVDGMGHDLPHDLWEPVIDIIRRTADRRVLHT